MIGFRAQRTNLTEIIEFILVFQQKINITKNQSVLFLWGSPYLTIPLPKKMLLPE